MTRTTIRLSDDLFRLTKKMAAERGRTMTAVIEEGLKIVLAESRRKPRKRVVLPVSKATGGLLPGVSLDRMADLYDIMDGL